LFERQVIELDHCVADIRRYNGNVLNRAGLIRAAIEGLLKCAIDHTQVRSEADVCAQLTRRLRP
jgi:hypothetical protein